MPWDYSITQRPTILNCDARKIAAESFHSSRYTSFASPAHMAGLSTRTSATQGLKRRSRRSRAGKPAESTVHLPERDFAGYGLGVLRPGEWHPVRWSLAIQGRDVIGILQEPRLPSRVAGWAITAYAAA